jgi:hypothetical protein
MKCDICGREIESHETTYLRGERVAGSWYDNAKLNKWTICEDCANERNSTLKSFAWGLGLLVSGLVIVGLVFRLLN